MARYEIVVVGASAGGVEVLIEMVKAFPPRLRAPVLVVLHVSGESMLPSLLERVARVPVAHANDGQRLVPGRIYVAPPDRQMTVRDGRILLSRGPRENGHRPAIDPLFRSAAREFRDRAIGVILCGQLDDGAAGMLAIKTRGGLTVAQDPKDATFPSMPRNAMRYVDVDHVLSVADLGPCLVELLQGESMPARKRNKRAPRQKIRLSERALSAARLSARRDSDILVCPECQGPLHRQDGGELTQWQCAVGHTFSPESLTEAQTDALERVLWMAVRTLSERAQAQRQTTTRLQGSPRTRMLERVEATDQDVALIRSILDRL